LLGSVLDNIKQFIEKKPDTQARLQRAVLRRTHRPRGAASAPVACCRAYGKT
jgi:hypothetical protein